MFTSQVRDERARVQPIPLRSKKKRKSSEDRHRSKFVDCLTVKVKAGNGGDGMVSLASLYRNEFAGPDGGKVTLNYFWDRAQNSLPTFGGVFWKSVTKHSLNST